MALPTDRATRASTEPASGLDHPAGIPSADDVRRVADMLEPKDFEPIAKRAADEIYERILHSCEDYLRDNVEWNIASELAMLRRENQQFRTELYEVDRALGCLSLGQAARLGAIKETLDHWRQASAKVWRLQEKVAVIPELVRTLEAVAEKGVRSLALYERIRAALASAQGIEAGTGETEGLDAKRESPVGNADAPDQPPPPAATTATSNSPEVVASEARGEQP